MCPGETILHMAVLLCWTSKNMNRALLFPSSQPWRLEEEHDIDASKSFLATDPVYRKSSEMLRFLVDEVLGFEKEMKFPKETYRDYLDSKAAGSLYSGIPFQKVKLWYSLGDVLFNPCNEILFTPHH